MKSGKSERNVKSTTSCRSYNTAQSPGNISTFLVNYVNTNFDAIFKKICIKFDCSFRVLVENLDNKIESLTGKSSSLRKVKPLPISEGNQIKLDDLDLFSFESVKAISYLDGFKIITVYKEVDGFDNVTELLLNKVTIPRPLLQVLILIVPFLRFLTKISMKYCKIDGYAIHELHKMIISSLLTDICLDGSTIDEENITIILSSKAISSLSLSMCNINDNTCRQIGIQIQYLGPSETTLRFLNLSSNDLTDVGVEHLANALRSNRHLIYLNLANNEITDEGACVLLNVLMEFPMNKEEAYWKRQRHMQYLKLKNKLRAESAKRSVVGTSMKAGKSMVRGKGRIYEATFDERTSYKAAEMLGVLFDPFGPDYTTIRGERFYSNGNLVLSYLNLSYTKITIYTLSTVLKVLNYQMKLKTTDRKKKTVTGLMKIVVEGNNFPDKCKKCEEIDDCLRYIMARQGLRRPSKSMSTKSTT